MDTDIIKTEAFHLTENDFFIRVLVAIGIGLVIGLEREHAAMDEKTPAFAGIRTFILVVLLGFIAGMLYFLLIPAVFVTILCAVILLTGISYYITASKGDIGTTTEFSLLFSFFLGTLSFLGLIKTSLMLMVFVVALLSAKVKLQTIIGKITPKELIAFIRFVIIALLIFPFLPDENYGYYNNLNPREIGWIIVLTSGLGFAGYILMKFLGPKIGMLLSGIVGGLVSSTAVTWVFAKQSKKNEALSSSCAVAILAASSIMILRVLGWTFIFNKILFQKLYIPILLIFSASTAITLLFFFKENKDKTRNKISLPNKPLDLQNSIVFGCIYVGILLFVSYANENMGQKGLYITSVIAGISDIDAISIGVSKLAGKSLDFPKAAHVVLIATLSNTLVKMGIGLTMGSIALRKYLLIGYGVIFLVGLATLLFNF